MVTSTYNKFNIAVEYIANGLIRASTVGDTFGIMLTNTLPTADLKTSTQLTLISSGNGYTNGLGGTSTIALTASTLGSTVTPPVPVIVLGSTITITASSVTSTAGIGPFRYVAFVDFSTIGIINSTTSSQYWPSNFVANPAGYSLIAWYDYGTNLTLTPGETFTISPDASSGIFQIA